MNGCPREDDTLVNLAVQDSLENWNLSYHNITNDPPATPQFSKLEFIDQDLRMLLSMEDVAISLSVIKITPG